ncbi:hypothetical protein GOV05_04525 [Candidatus Woesearchaeota archaeon]|nr:hypothetical protein [Candidatus Woesearchaeota archaeon]
MIKKEPLSFLVKDKYVKILTIFFSNPSSSFYVNQLKKMTGLSPKILIEELRNLENKKVLIKQKLANAHFYKLNKKNPDVLKIKKIL